MTNKFDFKNLLINFSIILYVLVCCVRYYVDNLILPNISIAMMILANMALIFNIFIQRKLRLVNKQFLIVSILLFIPSLYKNAYLLNKIYEPFLYYFMTISYSVLFFSNDINKSNIDFALKLFLLFALLTGIVTWISLFNPSIYVTKIIPLMPSNIHEEITNNFIIFNNRMGLTSHYSRNAFFVIIGMLSSIYFSLEKKSFLTISSIIFFVLTLLLIGKRGHFIFYCLSLICAYLIINKFSLKNILNIFYALLIVGAIALIGIVFIPEIGMTFERIFKYASDDFSNGRLSMYKEIFEMYKDRGFIGIGWQKYVINVNFAHPGVHNDYIQLLCETGVSGFFSVIGSNMYILNKSIKYAKKEENAISFIILVYNIFFMLYSLTGLPHYDVETYMYYFLINSILFSFIMKKKYF